MDPIEPLITAFHAEGRPRVWSLVVTIFGDAVQHRGGRIATLHLQELLERVGIEAGALRTALSRLTRDGWVLRDREGRNSFYRLSESAQAEITKAAADIYAAPRDGKVVQWVMARGKATPAKGISVAPHLWLVPADCATEMPEHICITGTLTSFPEHAAERVLTPDHRAALNALGADIAALDGLALTPLDAMAARMLLIHRWRRIVLRYPDVPAELMPADAEIPNPRKLVADAYNALVPASEKWLGEGDGITLPDIRGFSNRFQ